MAYAHIENLYRPEVWEKISMFREVFAMEKIHGSSAWITWDNGDISYYAGGMNQENFIALFDEVSLREKLVALGHSNMIVYGEAFGGKHQGMSETYGKALQFFVFDVKVGDHFLSVNAAEAIAKTLGLSFVPYKKVPCTIEALNTERDAPSAVALILGMGSDKPREGIVIRPLISLVDNSGSRICAKHKGEKFSETKTVRKVDVGQQQVLDDAKAIAEEWVTEVRLQYVLDKIEGVRDMALTPKVATAMVEDVLREATGEILKSKEARKAIGRRAVDLYKKLVRQI